MRDKRIFISGLGVLVLLVLLAQFIGPLRHQAQAADAPPLPPARKTSLKVAFKMYEWWLLRWHDSQVVCQIYIEHEGLPSGNEVKYFCGDTILTQWLQTPACQIDNGDRTQCSGLYIHRAHVTPGEREIDVKLASPKVWVSISGCDPKPPENRCDKLPNLLLTGEEPLPGEQIIRVQGIMNGEGFSCPGLECSLPLPPTGPKGLAIEFWADSSFGDSSQHFTALVRTIAKGDFMSPEGVPVDKPLWYVDVISSQWQGAPQASCAEYWSSFPDVGGPPSWLTTPDRAEMMHSSNNLYYLAGSLIQQGTVDASDCPGNGLQEHGVANQCGMEKARPEVLVWQNRFDAEIIKVANQTGVPAQLMKNIFSRESQFWPGMFLAYNEVGLGQMTENGADTALLWNPSFFRQLCPLVFKTGVCQRGFGNLSPEQKAMLRGALVQKVNAACPNCPAGIDLSQANFSISVFARSLLANCQQAGQILYNSTQKMPGSVSSYTDLWRFTLVNYNAGPGCLASAVLDTVTAKQRLDWESVSSHLEPVCKDVIGYVEDISTVVGVPTPTATLPVPRAVTPTPGPVRTATAAISPTPSAIPTQAISPTPGPTPTLPAYPPPEASPTPVPYP
jgi:hypothetical protein